MRKYTNSLGIVCLEPDEGFLLKKNGQTFKKVYLGKNDRAELYEEVVDKDYVAYKPNDEEPDRKEESYYVLTSPGGNKFKLTISDDGEIKAEKI